MELSNELSTNFLQYSVTPIQTAIYNNAFTSIAKDWNVITDTPFIFNKEVSGDFKITDQKSSGRCWLFATLNVLRVVAGDLWKNEMDTKELEFSQSYLYFWDKYERYHRYLRYFIDINGLDMCSEKNHLMTNLCKDPLGDGGQWDMAKEVLKKYGVVPKKIFPDSHHARASAGMNKILTEMLKNDWVILSKADKSNYDTLINGMMLKVFNVLVSFLGKPPTEFNFEFTYKGKYGIWRNLTPKKLLEKTNFNPDDWISVVNDPRKENPFGKYYQVSYLGNTKHQHVGWLNVDMNRMKELTIKSINENKPVWFGCDVGAHRDRETGIHHPDIIHYKEFLGINIVMNKEDRLRYYDSVPSHAMVLTGYHSDTETNKTTRWKVENSWGSSSGISGYLLFTDEWFDEYVYQIVVHKNYLNENEKLELTNIHKLIMPWDPLGTLAK